MQSVMGDVTRRVWPLRMVGLLMGLLLASGCASTAMKGTPFYTGEYAKRLGPVEDRVNVWPLLYYREPALSVLWPIGEYTGDHVAIRPLLSAYGLDGPRPVVNVLWPLGQFDRAKSEYRFFPFFWGRHYAVAFPFWSYKSREDSLARTYTSDGRLLLLLYDFQRRTAPEKESGEARSYVRRRVLWRVVHYERDHKDVSVDVFPAITFDRREDGLRQFSFLWRLIRYETSSDGKRKLDLLFLPLIRKG